MSDDEFNDICNKVLLFLGISFDNTLLTVLDEEIVRSVYELDLGRPKKSLVRNSMYNVDIEKLLKRF